MNIKQKSPSTVVHRVPRAPLVFQSFDSPDSQPACFLVQRASRPLLQDPFSAVLSSQHPEVDRLSDRRVL